MTKEQAIEKIKWSIHINELTKDTNGSNTSINVEVLKTVLSMLEEQDKIIADLQKSVEQIYDDYQDVGKMAFNYSDKIEKQNKIIDLMAEKIYEEGIVWDNKEEVKQYFENKVKERR